MDLKYVQKNIKDFTLIENHWNIRYVKTYIGPIHNISYLYKHYTFPEGQKSYYREIRGSRSLIDTNSVLKLLEESESQSSGCLLFEYKSLSSLFFFLQTEEAFDTSLLVTNLLRSLSKVHSKNFIHRNLSLQTIHLSSDHSVKFGGLEAMISLEELQELYGVEVLGC